MTDRKFTARLNEIEVQARKALDALYHAADAIVENSPNNRDHELRATCSHLNRIIELTHE